MRQSLRKRGTIVGAVALAAAFVPTAGNALGCQDSPEIDTLRMSVAAITQTAAPGDKIKLLVTVTRAVAGDEQAHVPASGIDSIVVLNPTWPYMAGEATTKTDGTAVVKIAVPRDAPRGWLGGYGVAEAQHGPRVCGDSAGERGDWAGERIVKIRR